MWNGGGDRGAYQMMVNMTTSLRLRITVGGVVWISDTTVSQ